MPRHHSSSDRNGEHPADSALQISTTVRVIKKRPCAVNAQPSASPPRQVKCLQNALDQLTKSIHQVQHKLQSPALEETCAALNKRPPSGQFPAVCIHTGTSAAAGDSSSFNAVLDHIRHQFSDDVEICSLHPSRHDTLRTVADAFSNVDSAKRLVVAVEHAHLFHPDLLSDLVYILHHSSVHRTSSEAEFSLSSKSVPPPPVSAVFAIPHTTALYDCLNVRDAACLATTLVRMPTQEQAFESVVSALSQRRGILFTSQIFNLIETHFSGHDMSLAMLTRTLRQLITLHYASTPLADFIHFIDYLNDDEPLRKEARTKLRALLTTDYFRQQINQLQSVRMRTDLGHNVAECTQNLLSSFEKLATWKRILTALESLSLRLDSVCKGDRSGWHKGSDRNVPPSRVGESSRVSIFKLLLPTDRDSPPGNRLKLSLCSSIKKLSRRDLRRFAIILIEELEVFPCFEAHGISALIQRVKNILLQLDKKSTSDETDVDMGTLNATLRRSDQQSGQSEIRRHATGSGAARAKRNQLLRASANEARQTDPRNSSYNQLTAVLEVVFNLAEPLQTLTMHEMILYSNVEELSCAGGGLSGGAQPRLAIFKALRNPSIVFRGISELETPDSAVAFRILAEGGRLVSIYDWYNIFASTLTAANLASATSDIMEMDGISTAEIQARFARACSELELIGLLKYTNRKTDHVARLAFE